VGLCLEETNGVSFAKVTSPGFLREGQNRMVTQ